MLKKFAEVHLSNGKSRNWVFDRLIEYGYSRQEINQVLNACELEHRVKTGPLVEPVRVKIKPLGREVAILVLVILIAVFASMPSALRITGMATASCGDVVELVDVECSSSGMLVTLEKQTSYDKYLINDRVYPALSIKEWKRVLPLNSEIRIVPMDHGLECEEVVYNGC